MIYGEMHVYVYNMLVAFAGATVSKGINRGIGTLIGGGLGCLAAVLAAQIGGIAKPIIIALTLFLFGAFVFIICQMHI